MTRQTRRYILISTISAIIILTASYLPEVLFPPPDPEALIPTRTTTSCPTCTCPPPPPTLSSSPSPPPPSPASPSNLAGDSGPPSWRETYPLHGVPRRVREFRATVYSESSAENPSILSRLEEGKEATLGVAGEWPLLSRPGHGSYFFGLARNWTRGHESEIPILRNVVYVDGHVRQAPSREACVAAAEAGGGEVRVLAMVANNMCGPPNNWEVWNRCVIPYYMVLQDFYLAGLFDPRFASGEWGEEEEARLRSARLAADREDKRAFTAEEYREAAEALIEMRPGMIVDSYFRSQNIGERYFAELRAGALLVMLDGLGPGGLIFSDREADTSRRAIVCLENFVGSAAYVYGTHPNLDRHFAYSIRGARHLTLTNAFGRHYERTIPWSDTVLLVSRQAPGVSKSVEPWEEYSQMLRATAVQAGFNFEVLEVENSEYRTQMLQFFMAKVVIYTTGGLMTNTLYVRRGSHLVTVWEWGPFERDTRTINVVGEEEPWFTNVHIDRDKTPGWGILYGPNHTAEVIDESREYCRHVFYDLNNPTPHCVVSIHPPIEAVDAALSEALADVKARERVRAAEGRDRPSSEDWGW